MTKRQRLPRAHVVVGGYPVGASAGHDMGYARLRLLELLYEDGRFATTVAGDFTDLDRWLDGSELLHSVYVDFENLLAPIMPTIRTYAVGRLGVAALGAVHGCSFG